jgi:hypothetical protein
VYAEAVSVFKVQTSRWTAKASFNGLMIFAGRRQRRMVQGTTKLFFECPDKGVAGREFYI